MSSPSTQPSFEIRSWLTSKFLEDVLRKHHHHPSLTVESFDVHSSTTKGDNFASSIHKISVIYNNSKQDQTKELLIMKTLPEGEISQGYIKDMQVFEREIFAYGRLIPALGTMSDLPITMPKFYPTERAYTVILEDMSPRGYKMAERTKRLDLSHSVLALKTLARFHAHSYALVQRDPAIIDLIPVQTSADKGADFEEQFAKTLYKTLASIVKTWPGYERFSEIILYRYDEIRRKVKECWVTDKKAFNVINHGDFWVNNMLFRYEEESKHADDMCMIDLQMLRYAPPSLDLQYFLTSSLADGIREEHEDSLLEVYHNALTETLESAGVVPNIYSLNDLKNDYKDKSPFGFHMGILITAAVVAGPNETLELNDITEESMIDGSANPIFKTLRGEGFKNVFKKHLLYFEKCDVL